MLDPGGVESIREQLLDPERALEASLFVEDDSGRFRLN